MKSPVDFLAMGAAAAPDRIALSDGSHHWTFTELDALSTRRAETLASAGVVPGSVVQAFLGPDVPSVMAIHAVRRVGGVLVPLNGGWSREERDAVVRGSGAEWRLEPGTWTVERLGAPGSEPVSDLPGPDPLAVLWTSGTGGRARGVVLDGRALLHTARASAQRLDLRPGDQWYAALQPSHVGGLALVVRAAALGCGVVARGGFDAQGLARLIEAERVSHTSLVPVMLRRYLEQVHRRRGAGAGLRTVLVGGAHAPFELVSRAVAAEVPVALTWGMTEASSQVATAPPEMVRADPGTVGVPLEGVEVATGPGGELWVRGPIVSHGLVGHPGGLADPDGWYHTGDLGVIDDRGRIRVTGRRSNRIISGGVNIDPTAVESVVRSLPGVADCVVVGLPDPEWGERVAAAVVPRAGVGIDIEVLDRAQSESLSAGKRVRAWRVLDELPVNANGKVDRSAVREAFSRPGP